MILSELKKLLAENTYRNIRFVLPTGSKIPPHAHVTEGARMDKRIIDCGGNISVQKRFVACKHGSPTIPITGLPQANCWRFLINPRLFLKRKAWKWTWNTKHRLFRNFQFSEWRQQATP